MPARIPCPTFAYCKALQYANVGQGILAGIAILFVALILDRVVQGKKRV